jgi:pyrroline-5-carboxylate reductase
VLIAVKPLIVSEVAQAIRAEVGPKTLVISVAASVPSFATWNRICRTACR